jgi:hypothetical protein
MPCHAMLCHAMLCYAKVILSKRTAKVARRTVVSKNRQARDATRRHAPTSPPRRVPPGTSLAPERALLRWHQVAQASVHENDKRLRESKASAMHVVCVGE